jgi:hypothetical protein
VGRQAAGPGVPTLRWPCVQEGAMRKLNDTNRNDIEQKHYQRWKVEQK